MEIVENPTRHVPRVKAWRNQTIDSPEQWYYPLPEKALSAFKHSVENLKNTPWEQCLPTSEQKEAAGNTAAVVKSAMEEGRGFAIIPIPVDQFSREEQVRVYWLMGQLIGRPCAQNVQGTILYDVKDMGHDLSKGARFSVTNYESSFHTDNSFGSEILDYVGLHCLTTAKSGGLSQVLSGYAVYEELAARYPEDLQILSQPFHVDRRGGVKPGEGATAYFPVIQWAANELLFRYLRFWIEAGHEKVGQPLTGKQVAALNRLDAILKERQLAAEFALRPGDMYFINNRWILHNRTAFEDYDEPDRRRHLVRLWLQNRL